MSGSQPLRKLRIISAQEDMLRSLLFSLVLRISRKELTADSARDRKRMPVKVRMIQRLIEDFFLMGTDAPFPEGGCARRGKNQDCSMCSFFPRPVMLSTSMTSGETFLRVRAPFICL